MDGKDLDLIALSYVLSRYKAYGEIIDDSNDLSVEQVKTAMFAGTSYSDDVDININVGSVETESNVTIIEQTVECDEHENHDHADHERTEPSTAESVDDRESQQANPTPLTEQQEENKPIGLSGKLFQYFKGGNNEPK